MLKRRNKEKIEGGKEGHVYAKATTFDPFLYRFKYFKNLQDQIPIINLIKYKRRGWPIKPVINHSSFLEILVFTPPAYYYQYQTLLVMFLVLILSSSNNIFILVTLLCFPFGNKKCSQIFIQHLKIISINVKFERIRWKKNKIMCFFFPI